jgi:thiosulfate dehydrogenase
MRVLVPLLVAAVAACRPAADAPPPPPGATTVIAALTDADFPATPFGQAARRGLALMNATRDSLPDNVGSDLRCTSCHLDEGRRPFALPLTGVQARYPQYRTRSGAIATVEDRINDCFERSLAGRALPHGDQRVRAMEAYFAFLSRGVAIGEQTAGQGIDSVDAPTPNADAGKVVFASQCARCHGANGEGTTLATPLWGPRSYAIAAAMARVRMAAGFIRRNMPFDLPGTLTDQQALDVAAYINGQPRPDFAGKEKDWPNGDAPPDTPYRTAGRQR